MDTLNAIFTRRSIRKYKDTPLSSEQITNLLKAGMAAPTARNMQSWDFLVINTREGLDKLMNAHPYAKMLKTAPLAIIVCSNAEREDPAPGYGPQTGAAAIQNMLLAATAMGLGSVWLGVTPREERVSSIKKAFNFPQHITPIGVAVFGYADETPAQVDRYDSAKVHFEGWNK